LAPMFTVEPFLAQELGNASFLIADREAGVAAVIDPFRDTDAYQEHAEANHLRLTRALDTHVHNDFVSGARELKASAGTAIDPLEVDATYQLGNITLKAIHTPGHTPDHKSYLVLEGGRPRALFSGGAVMVGGVARTDLFGPHLAVHLGLEALRTLQIRLRGLPDDIAIYPTHGGGSFCGIAGGSGHETTLGQERIANPFFLTTEVMQFLARILDQRRYPDYYNEMGEINRVGAALLGRRPAPPTRLSADEVAALIERDAAVIDLRPGRLYDHGHIPGSYNVGLDGGPFSVWVGWLIPRARRLVLVGGTGADYIEAQRQLHRIGFDNISGALHGGMDVWQTSGRTLSKFETATIEDMAQWILRGDEMTLVDARDDYEWASGHVPGAMHIYVPDLRGGADRIPTTAPVAVYCGAGYRAGIAASLLEQAGLTRIVHVIGRYDDWARKYLAEAVPAH
jgi:hydroxyacylglutathione hydrolase